jgi:hypothetical protein
MLLGKAWAGHAVPLPYLPKTRPVSILHILVPKWLCPWNIIILKARKGLRALRKNIQASEENNGIFTPEKNFKHKYKAKYQLRAVWY